MKFTAAHFAVPFVLAAALSGASSAGGETKPARAFSFREPPLNSLGTKSMDELRGKPVVVDFWGQH